MEETFKGIMTYDMELLIRPMIRDDWSSVAEIYRQGIETGDATFETTVPDWESWNSAHVEKCRLVAIQDGSVAGWAALVPVSKRKVYNGVAEVSIYISAGSRGAGTGKKLLKKLIDDSEKEGFWTLQAVVFPENHASLKIHESLGFRRVGFREKIGNQGGIWRDTILLERRSGLTGK